MLYLKIENPGVADYTAFTLLGASTSKDSQNSNTIGKFGSGNKHGVAVCLRNNLQPIIYCGQLALNFGTTPIVVNNGHTSTEFARVQVKYKGKDDKGKTKNKTEDLGFVLEYGASDWVSIGMALREFVSNAIDRSILEGEIEAFNKYKQANPYYNVEEAKEFITKYRKVANDYTKVVVEIVQENQVRAKDGFTRVFIPVNEEVFKFHANLGKWFLHFSEPESLTQTILPKKNRSMSGSQNACIYRRGVFVREYSNANTPSLFDYNLNNLKLDESRTVDDYYIKHHAAYSMQNANKEQICTLFNSMRTNVGNYWEHSFDGYGLNYEASSTSKEAIAARNVVWQNAFESIMGTNAVASTKEGGEFAERKGYDILRMPEEYVSFVEKVGIRTSNNVLTEDDKEGRVILTDCPNIDNVETITLDIWYKLVMKNKISNKEKPPEIKIFTKLMSAGSQLLGYYRDECIYINNDIAEGNSIQLRTTILEELAHYITGATDNSRDFQDYLLNLCVSLL